MLCVGDAPGWECCKPSQMSLIVLQILLLITSSLGVDRVPGNQSDSDDQLFLTFQKPRSNSELIVSPSFSLEEYQVHFTKSTLCHNVRDVNTQIQYFQLHSLRFCHLIINESQLSAVHITALVLLHRVQWHITACSGASPLAVAHSDRQFSPSRCLWSCALIRWWTSPPYIFDCSQMHAPVKQTKRKQISIQNIFFISYFISWIFFYKSLNYNQ